MENRLQRNRRDRGSILLWMGTAVAVLVAAALLSPGTERQVLLPWSDIPLPESCMTRLQFGFDCPGCGLTRSFLHIVDGNWKTAWQLNWVGFPIFALVVAQIPFATILWKSNSEKLRRWTSRLNLCSFVFVAGLLVLRWFTLLFSGHLI